MTKKPQFIISLFVILMMLFGILFASNAFNSVEDDFNPNFYNTILVSLKIDYGRPTTQYEYVTLNLNVSGLDVDLNTVRVQFSTDNENWSGFNTDTQKWEANYLARYQPFYSSYYIGSSPGLKTVYVRVVDQNENVGLASAKIHYGEDTQNSYVENPLSMELNDFLGPLNEAGINSGSGTLYDPYITSTNSTQFISKMPNVAELCYYIGDGNWSPWYKVENEHVDIPVTFNNKEGIKEVRIRTKNKHGVEGNTDVIYYLLDYSKPSVNLYTNYHSFIAIDGRLQFDLEVNDNLADILDFVVEVFTDDSKIVQRGKIKKYDEYKPTITSVEIDGLPEGTFNVKVTVTDEAGNKETQRIVVDSL